MKTNYDLAKIIQFFYYPASYHALGQDVVWLRKGIDLVKFEKEKQGSNRSIEASTKENFTVFVFYIYRIRYISYVNQIGM